MSFSSIISGLITNILGDEEISKRRENLQFNDAGHGYDPFGLHPEFIELGEALTKHLYQDYFRVISVDSHNIPTEGPAVLAANHSGTIPIDGVMIWADVLRSTNPPRVARTIADYFVPSLPVLSTLFARCGVVGGSRGNARALLEAGELLLIFPEGVPGISKRFSDRYRLQQWRLGHCELAIRHSAPIVPIGVIGAEEQMPQIGRIPLPGPIPHIPITASPIPLPVRYRIIYGEPLRFDQEYSPNDADDPSILYAATQRVKAAVQELIDRGLREREGVFK